MSVLIETTIGDLVLDLYVKERPRTCLNFLKLCKAKYYNFCLFHHIERDFLAQLGDPTGTGRGGESIFGQIYGDQAKYFEMEAVPKLKHVKRGTISMADNGEGAHGSQFFITLGENLTYLDDRHTVFGEVGEGLETLDKLNEAICDEENIPYKEIRISHTVILDDPFEDPRGLEVPSRSPSPTLDLLKTSRIAIDEEIDETQGKTLEEIEKEIELKEAKARAHILEIVGDIHHAEEKPPDNVLFVCKLNPVTTDDDLEVIFSRFGEIKCCEVIRDRKTGNSLQYAFVEFERPQDCESAYFKMDNVLIDDRRIHVDFSQSVAKNFQWKRQLDQNEKETGKDSSATKKKDQQQQKSTAKASQQYQRETTSAKYRDRGTTEKVHNRDDRESIMKKDQLDHAKRNRIDQSERSKQRSRQRSRERHHYEQHRSSRHHTHRDRRSRSRERRRH